MSAAHGLKSPPGHASSLSRPPGGCPPPSGRLVLRIIIPTLLTFALFVIVIFAILLPALEKSIMVRKREMIRELTHSAWNILANFEDDVQQGIMTGEEARREAIRQLRNLHYGEHNKEYFWVNDLTPRMIAHPYRRDLEGKDLSTYEDPTGKRLFVEMVATVKKHDEGFVSYLWQDHDDPEHIVPKESYVKIFKPWGWVVGTGIYVDDVQREIGKLTRRLGITSLIILLVAGGLLTLIAFQSLRTEHRRLETREALRQSELRYRTLVDSAGGSILMELEGDRLYANASALAMLGYTAQETVDLKLDDIIELTQDEQVAGHSHREQLLAGQDVPKRHEARLKRRDGDTIEAALSYSAIALGEKRGLIVVATDISERKAAEEAAGREEQARQEELLRVREQLRSKQREARELQVVISRLQPAVPTDLIDRQLTELQAAPDADAVGESCLAFRKLAAAMIQCGMRPHLVTRLISSNTDAVCQRLLDLAVSEQGEPPAEFALLVMGSQARREQTLSSDQDNALVFADVDASRLDETRSYFRSIGSKVCQGLELAGFSRCEADLMAANPDWVLSISEWEARFREWIATLEAEDLLNAKVFFDFRAACGAGHLIERLREYIGERLASMPRFFPQLARTMLFYEPPLGLFGNLRLSGREGKQRGFDVKAAMVPLVDYARLYALRNGVRTAGTMERLEELGALGCLRDEQVAEASSVFNALMTIRLQHQADRLLQGQEVDNWIAPGALSSIDRRIVKAGLAHVRTLQRSMSYDFLGQAGVP